MTTIQKLKYTIKNNICENISSLDNVFKCNNINLSQNILQDINIQFNKLNYIITFLRNFIINGIPKNGHFINKLKKDIYNSTNLQLKSKDIYDLLNIMHEEKKLVITQEEYNKLDDNVKKYIINISHNQTGGGSGEEEPGFFSVMIDWISLFLDVGGLIPGIGMPLDMANTGLTGIRSIMALFSGEIMGFLDKAFQTILSAIAIMPGIGMAATGFKFSYKILKWLIKLFL